MDKQEEENKGIKVEVSESCNYGCVGQDSEHVNCEDKLGDKILGWKPRKIRIYPKNDQIMGCQFFFKNRSTGEEKVIIEIKADTLTPQDEESVQEFVLGEMEEITKLRVWLKEDTTRLIGFEVTTSRGTVRKFGYGKEEELIKIQEIEDGNSVIVGFGACGNKKEGMTSLYCYFMGKKEYNLELYSGIFYFRRLVHDVNKKKELEDMLPKVDDKHKALFRICQLPDNHFFGIIKYGLS